MGIERKTRVWYNRKKDGDSMDFILSILPNFLVYLFKSAMNIFRAFKIKVNLIECHLDGPRNSDGVGGFTDSSRVHFRIEILNRKDKKFIINKMCCKAMREGKIVQDNILCYNKDTYKKIALRSTYEPLSTIDVLPQSSVQYDVLITPNGDLIHCDKIVFSYSKGIKRRKIVIWKKEHN